MGHSLMVLLVLVMLILLALCALLWDGVRTHKTVDQLKGKVEARAGEIAADAITKATAIKDQAGKKA